MIIRWAKIDATMQRILLLSCLIGLLLAPIGIAENSPDFIEIIQTLNGVEFKNVRVRSHTQYEVSFFHEDGAATVKVEELDEGTLEMLAPKIVAVRHKAEADRVQREAKLKRLQLEAEMVAAAGRQKKIEEERIEKEKEVESARNQRTRPANNANTIPITQERYNYYFSSQAREEAKQFLRQNGTTNPSAADVELLLKMNERLEHYNGR